VTEIFANSFNFIALLNPADQDHAAAVAASQQLSTPLVTTNWVLVELADALGFPQTRPRVVAFLRRLGADPNIRVMPPGQHLYERGLDLYAWRPGKAWSLTDCISFVVMMDRGLTDALTGDHHFEQAGFRALLRDG
jgi:predicted nucleic acid-binding protein